MVFDQHDPRRQLFGLFEVALERGFQVTAIRRDQALLALVAIGMFDGDGEQGAIRQC